MTTPFSKLMAGTLNDAGTLALEVPPDWMQGRSAFGGLQAALALKAMRLHVPDLVLRTLQATYVAPVQGLVRAHARVLRRGKSAVHVEAHLGDAAEPLALFTGVFGAPRPSTVTVTPTQPAVESTGARERAPRLFPSFTQHFATRWLRGLPPFTGDTSLQQVIEIDMLDEGMASEGHVVAIADLIPPIALSHLRVPSPGSTLTWMLELLTDRVDHLPLGGWRVDAELVAARDGYTSQSVMVWGPGGVPVALSRQSMLVYG